MFDWIPVESYTHSYYYVMLFVVLLTFQKSQVLELDAEKNLSYYQGMGIFVIFFVILFMGLRPISWHFGDMGTYASYFTKYQEENTIMLSRDMFFEYFMLFSSKIIDIQTFFLLCVVLYVCPLYLACKKWFSDYWFFAFLLLSVSFSFWAYGTNGIRHGIATSFFLYAISKEKRINQFFFLLIAVNFHNSLILPTLAFVLVQYYNHPKLFLYFWFICIPLSLVAGGFWESFFASLGLGDERISYLTEGNVNDDDFSYTGFRWDFLLYSATGVLAGWYYIFKKGFTDSIYDQMFNIYLFCNGFWILVIRANFSNRFAYLSWFMLALIICYPLLKEFLFEKQNKKLGWILMAYFGFTFLMHFLNN